MKSCLDHSALGKTISYPTQYDPGILFPIERAPKRNAIGIDLSPGQILPFVGYDLWNHYEVSWLNMQGKPEVAIVTLVIPIDSPYLIESKSLKLYFNALNETKFPSVTHIKNLVQQDLSNILHAPVSVRFQKLENIKHLDPLMISISNGTLDGISLDKLDISCDVYTPCPDFLILENALNQNQNFIQETLTSNLLKSNCLVTGQPDWASIQIKYTGRKINHEGLLKYLISFRHHNEFHEQCIERIFMDILNRCQPSKLSIYARYTRRGGIDINPFRSTEIDFEINNPKLSRQ